MALSPTKLNRPSRLRGARLWVARGVLVTLSLAFSLGALEIGLRVSGCKPQTATALGTFYEYDPLLGWRGKPDIVCRFATTDFDVVVEHGSDGFRRPGPENVTSQSEPKPPTVWILGDSFTWGWGVAQGETYVDRLNQQCRGTYFRNLGHPGHSAVQEYLLLRDMLEKGERPAAVAVMFCPNDLVENMALERGRPYAVLQGGEVNVTNVPVPAPRMFNVSVWLKNHSLAVNHINYYLMRCRQKLRRMTDARSVTTNAEGAIQQRKAVESAKSLDPYWNADRAVVLQEIYRQMNDLCRERNIPFSVIGAPHHNGTLAQICYELDVPFVDVSEPFTHHESGPFREQPLIFPNDAHCTELGNRLLAEAIQPQSEKLVSGDASRATRTAGKVILPSQFR